MQGLATCLRNSRRAARGRGLKSGGGSKLFILMPSLNPEAVAGIEVMKELMQRDAQVVQWGGGGGGGRSLARRRVSLWFIGRKSTRLGGTDGIGEDETNEQAAGEGRACHIRKQARHVRRRPCQRGCRRGWY